MNGSDLFSLEVAAQPKVLLGPVGETSLYQRIDCLDPCESMTVGEPDLALRHLLPST